MHHAFLNKLSLNFAPLVLQQIYPYLSTFTQGQAHLARLPADVQERSLHSSLEVTARRVDLALLISTNKKSTCLNQAGYMNNLSRSTKDVMQYEVNLHQWDI